MADTAVSFLLENVSLILKYCVDLISNAKDDLEQLERDLRLLKSYLEEADKKPKDEAPFKELERQIRKVVYEAEDTIDLCLMQTATAGTGKRMLRRLDPKRLTLAEQVRTLSEKKVKPMLAQAKEFANAGNAHGPGKSEEEQRLLPPKVQSLRRNKIVGLEDEEKKIIEMLTAQTKELDVISIIGMPGLGKTTLAWKIFQNKDVKFQFPVCIWVYVSRAFSRKDVLLKILRHFESQDRSDLHEDELIDKVCGYLKDEKFFLVLDDIWTFQAWKAIEEALPKENWMGKVLITSRSTEVCQQANPAREPHKMRFLKDDESWQLLQLEAFGNFDDCHEDLKPIGRSLAHECEGLPLAIVVIGGFLVGKRSPNKPINVVIDEWTTVRDNLDKYLLREDEQGIGISNIVSWSYSIMPNHLRECFLYLGVFPENYEIPAWTLTQLWITEGSIQRRPQQSSLEEIAKENLNDLVSRNLVMVEKTNLIGEVKTVRVHDVIRAFCISKGSSDQNLYQEVRKTNEGFDPKVSEVQNYRRLCIHSDLQEFLAERPKGPHVRSFLCFNKASFELAENYSTNIPDSFPLLRVLDSKSIKFKKFPNRITKLFHLRYLTISIDDLHVIPEAISGLRYLQTFLVETKKSSLEIEADIWKMIQLRHLKTKAAIKLAPPRKEGNGGENLLTLTRLSTESCNKDVFRRASKLKKLGIHGKLATVFREDCIESLAFLEELKLENDLYTATEPKDQLHHLPKSQWFPPNLKRLTISSTRLSWDHISTLASIRSLQVLKLKDNAFVGFSWPLNGDCFGSLHFLLIADTNLVHWEASTKNFPKLGCLVLHNCEKLQEIPFGLAEKLEKLDIENLGPSAVKSAKIIEKSKQGQPKAGMGGVFKLIIGPGCKHPATD